MSYFFLSILSANAQGVGINETGAAPDNSALLDLNSSDKGFLMTRADTANIIAPAFGLMTLAPLDSCLYLFNGNAWMGMGGGGSDCNCNCASTTPSAFICGSSFTDARDGTAYNTVEIGNQCWMSENLNYTPSTGNSWCYDDISSNCDSYGRLYDWNAAMDNTASSSANPSGVAGICPIGWHLPSDDEWKELEMFLGMTQIEADNTGYRGTDEGDKMKSIAPTWNGTNSSGFSGLSGGLKNSSGSFLFMGTNSLWWSTTETGTFAFSRALVSTQTKVYRGISNQVNGASIRCVKD